MAAPTRIENLVGPACKPRTVVWSRAAFAQSPSKVYRVGLLSAGAPIADNSPFWVPLIRGLAQHGYELGRNLTFERRGADGYVDRLPGLVAELATSKVDLIITSGYPPALAAKKASAAELAAIRQLLDELEGGAS